ncbi:hypothetical protein K431DRAFT_284467 [Polychaeton citri CBS 116435]|uniref:C2H2-type domain-containing protein n=1 Tax=Polychaeton citri CBS 116435 TaxID=1314669 RepID=A0A9P4QB82_9PEZI|nr:hypothetical protein K431DRAFT_284467 [Polychaeton citri CBS 116435]
MAHQTSIHVSRHHCWSSEQDLWYGIQASSTDATPHCHAAATPSSPPWESLPEVATQLHAGRYECTNTHEGPSTGQLWTADEELRWLLSTLDETTTPSSSSSTNLKPSTPHGMGSVNLELSTKIDSSGCEVLVYKKVFQCWDHGCDGRTFSTLSNYRRHCREQSVSNAELVPCPTCGKRFTRATARDLHLRRQRCGHFVETNPSFVNAGLRPLAMTVLQPNEQVDAHTYKPIQL